MRRHEVVEELLALDIADRMPMYVISYNRAGDAPMLDYMGEHFERLDDVHVIVRESQEVDYAVAYPGMTVEPLPDEEIGSCGEARWGAHDVALGNGHDRSIMLDDDVTYVDALWQGWQKNGAEKSAHGPGLKADFDNSWELVLQWFGQIGNDCLDENRDAVVGGARKRQMSFSPENHQLEYIVNGGVTPRQVMVWDHARLHRHGIRLNQQQFGVTGEDIGLAATALAADLDMFTVPSVIYGHWAESENIFKSMIRNPENAAELHAWEYEQLQHYPIRDYLRVKRSVVDGSPEWMDVNWQKAAKIRNRPTIKEYW